MNDEPTHAEIAEDDGQAATKGDVRRSQDELAQIVGKAIAKETNALRSEMKSQGEELRAEMKSEAEETRRHFDVVYEKMRDDLLGASTDAADLLNNQVPDHEDRIVDLEKQAGLPAGPRYQHIK